MGVKIDLTRRLCHEATPTQSLEKKNLNAHAFTNLAKAARKTPKSFAAFD